MVHTQKILAQSDPLPNIEFDSYERDNIAYPFSGEQVAVQQAKELDSLAQAQHSGDFVCKPAEEESKGPPQIH